MQGPMLTTTVQPTTQTPNMSLLWVLNRQGLGVLRSYYDKHR